jgi:REP element-mobilizing transposase RayT
MPQSLAKVAIHIVFSTKNREPHLHDSDLWKELYAYMATILRDNVDSPALLINGVDDHVHGLVLLSRKFAIMKVIDSRRNCETLPGNRDMVPLASVNRTFPRFGNTSRIRRNIIRK